MHCLVEIFKFINDGPSKTRLGVRHGHAKGHAKGHVMVTILFTNIRIFGTRNTVALKKHFEI